ncbi:CDGSH iron-sulfur domain-containing protein [Streptomyces sp. NPDC003077]|uniref:CDGSH iron-sulfur domain-containing protein n=1 Tax=Streptomyces sp. NPDC003077 TaxID=3154443 RepID=UPI0033B537C9
MPNARHEPDSRTDAAHAAAEGRGREVRRVTRDPGGPLLIEGPVEVTLEDGGTARSDRPTVALCMCRRSKIYPWCDTSHRGRPRRRREATSQREAGEEHGG